MLDSPFKCVRHTNIEFKFNIFFRYTQPLTSGACQGRNVQFILMDDTEYAPSLPGSTENEYKLYFDNWKDAIYTHLQTYQIPTQWRVRSTSGRSLPTNGFMAYGCRYILGWLSVSEDIFQNISRDLFEDNCQIYTLLQTGGHIFEDVKRRIVEASELDTNTFFFKDYLCNKFHEKEDFYEHKVQVTYTLNNFNTQPRKQLFDSGAGPSSSDEAGPSSNQQRVCGGLNFSFLRW